MVATAVRRAYAGAKALLAIIGLAALAGLVALGTQEGGLASRLPALADLFSESANTAAGPIQSGPQSQLEREQRAVTEYIARRYRVSETAVSGYVSAAYRAGAQYSVDPLLILAVMAVESRYNPVAESTVGAKGLMQVIPKFHLDKLLDHGGEHALLEPDVNIQVGSQILREYQRRFRDTETALQMYGGALDEPTAQYAAKVFAEKARLELLRQKTRRSQSA
jgi:soluble lytic murein transglycosylase-like protein